MQLRALAVTGMLATCMTGASRAADFGTPSCRTTNFSISPGPQLSPATGQNPVTIKLTNRGPSACVLFGYPVISVADRRGTLPFTIRHGGDQMVTPRRPTRVLVRVGRAAFVLVNKYRCDSGDLRLARTLRLRFPHDTSAGLSLAMRRWSRWGYCGKGDPGSTVSTSPFSPTWRAAMRY